MCVPSLRSLAPIAALCLLAQIASAADGAAGPSADLARYRAWVQEMKTTARGPFERIRWFCADGSVLEPVPFGCKDHGGGVQHGELNERARTLRERGYRVANVLADLDAKAFLVEDGHRDALAQMLVEQFLVGIDDGWILRRARFYRGAFQEEDERRSARDLLQALLSSLLAARAAVEPDARIAGYRRFQEILAERQPVTLLVHPQIAVLVDRRFEAATPGPLGLWPETFWVPADRQVVR